MRAAPPELTLVIITYERRNYLLRQIGFWSNENVRLLVLDGSQQPLSSDELQAYRHYVDYNHLIASYSERVRIAATLVKTPFVCFLCDDEFYLPQSLYDSLNFLKIHSDYVSAIGRCVGFRLVPDLQGRMAYVHVKARDIRSNNPRDRIILHMLPYAPTTYYSVMRTECWRSAITVAFKHNYSCVYTTALLFVLTLSFDGKSIIL
jgi:glycosyltransferase domain-containing protein